MDAAAIVSQIQAQQDSFKVLTMMMLIDYLFPKQPKLKDNDVFDFLIVGGGTAGCVLANRLMKANFSVLVLEAGPIKPYDAFLPGALMYMPHSRLDWNDTVVPDHFTGRCHRCFGAELPSGKVLGGSSAINFMVTARGNYRDYHRWADAANDPSWEYKHLIHLYKRSERLLAPEIANSPLGQCRGIGGNPPDTGDGGPGKIGIGIDNATNIPNYLKSFEEMGNEIVLDLNGKHSTGYARALFSIGEGFRQSTAYGYLIPAVGQDNKTNPKLFVSTNSFVTKIVIDECKHAIGVMVEINNTKPIFLRARKEVILTAGAIRSPQLLMVSGIGREKYLREMGIKLICDLPVGENFQDQVGISFIHKTKEKSSSAGTDLQKHPASVVVGYKSLDLCGEYPDYGTNTYIYDKEKALLEFCSQPFNFLSDICNKLYQEGKGREVAHTVLYGLYPKSRGKLYLKSANPKDAPIIDPCCFSDKDDMKNTVKYIKDFIPILNTTFFKNVGAIMVDPVGDKCCAEYGTDEYWECYAYCMSNSMWNYCGTCSLGAVVDSRLKVFGVQNLRVADASVIPHLIAGGNYQPTIVIAEKASDMIIEDWKE
ncbi:ecdysone oxidase-like [Anticarsia gemmatalis]|uniref:ecdysone oxidase-like n=1 Tax=Anticarsia gemmatalis TaxID=129554 RepID=UPI003F762003